MESPSSDECMLRWIPENVHQKIFKSDFRNSLLNWSTQRRDRKREISRCLSLRFCLLLLSILLEIPNLHFPAIKGNKLTFQWKNKKNKLFNKPNLSLKPKIWCLFYFLTCFSLKKYLFTFIFILPVPTPSCSTWDLVHDRMDGWNPRTPELGSSESWPLTHHGSATCFILTFILIAGIRKYQHISNIWLYLMHFAKQLQSPDIYFFHRSTGKHPYSYVIFKTLSKCISKLMLIKLIPSQLSYI